MPGADSLTSWLYSDSITLDKRETACISAGIDFISHQEALDTSTPIGKAMFTIVGAMAELERSVMRQRVIAGVEYAKRNGTRSGKPIGRPRAIFPRDEAVRLRKQGISLRRIAAKLGVGEGTVRRALQADVDSTETRQNPIAGALLREHGKN